MNHPPPSSYTSKIHRIKEIRLVYIHSFYESYSLLDARIYHHLFQVKLALILVEEMTFTVIPFVTLHLLLVQSGCIAAIPSVTPASGNFIFDQKKIDISYFFLNMTPLNQTD